MSRMALLGVAAAAMIGILAAGAMLPRADSSESDAVVGRPASARTTVLPAAAGEESMNRGQRILVLVAEDTAERQLARLQGAYRVLAVLRPRLAVLQIDDAAVDELRRDPEIAGVYERDVPPEVIARLRQDERLFVEAWIEQQASGDKQRRGEGLSWDAPGFEPPGPPSTKEP